MTNLGIRTSRNYSPELKIEIDGRSSAYKNGKARMISSAESKKCIGKILKPRKVNELPNIFLNYLIMNQPIEGNLCR